MAAARDEVKCAARGGMTKPEVVAAVRERDGRACTGCGMTEAQHPAAGGHPDEAEAVVAGVASICKAMETWNCSIGDLAGVFRVALAGGFDWAQVCLVIATKALAVCELEARGEEPQ